MQTHRERPIIAIFIKLALSEHRGLHSHIATT